MLIECLSATMMKATGTKCRIEKNREPPEVLSVIRNEYFCRIRKCALLFDEFDSILVFSFIQSDF